jgi:hypothetical protein
VTPVVVAVVAAAHKVMETDPLAEGSGVRYCVEL